MKREALCRVKVCPHPTDPWYHVCEKCGSPAVHHHHRIPKQMGGSKARDVKSNIQILCSFHHEQAHRIATAEGEMGSADYVGHSRGSDSLSAVDAGAEASQPATVVRPQTLRSSVEVPLGGDGRDAPLLDDLPSSPSSPGGEP